MRMFNLKCKSSVLTVLTVLSLGFNFGQFCDRTVIDGPADRPSVTHQSLSNEILSPRKSFFHCFRPAESVNIPEESLKIFSQLQLSQVR